MKTTAKAFIKGVVTLYGDTKQSISINNKLSRGEIISWKEYNLLQTTKSDLAFITPLILFYMIPIIGNVVLVLYFYKPQLFPISFLRDDVKSDLYTKSCEMVEQNLEKLKNIETVEKEIVKLSKMEKKELNLLLNLYQIKFSFIISLFPNETIRVRILKNFNILVREDEYLRKEDLMNLSLDDMHNLFLKRALKFEPETKHSVLVNWLKLTQGAPSGSDLNIMNLEPNFNETLSYSLKCTTQKRISPSNPKNE